MPVVDNVVRLMGVHGLTARGISHLVNVSPQAISEWKYNKRDPSLQTVLMLAEFFEVPGHRLVNAPFDALLTNELSDPERFHRVETKIKRQRRPLRSVDSDRSGTPKKRPPSEKPAPKSRPGVDQTERS